MTEQCKKPKQRRPGVPPGHLRPESPVIFSGIRNENHNIRTKEEFEAKRLSTAEYFAQLDRAHVFVAIVPFGSVSGVYFEAGYAAALGKPSIYFVPEGAGKVMPSLMAEAHLLKDYIKTVYFDSLDHVQRVLLERFS